PCAAGVLASAPAVFSCPVTTKIIISRIPVAAQNALTVTQLTRWRFLSAVEQANDEYPKSRRASGKQRALLGPNRDRHLGRWSRPSRHCHERTFKQSRRAASFA